MKEPNLSTKGWLALLFLYLGLLYPPAILSHRAANQTFLKGDCIYYRAVIDSLLKDGDLLLANNLEGVVPTVLDGQLSLGSGGGLVPKHPILMPLLSLPLYLILGDSGLLVFNILVCMLLMALILLLNRLFFAPVIAFVTAALYAAGSLFLEYTFNYSPDVFSTLLVVGGLYGVLSERYRAGALLLGLSIFAKLPNAPLVAAIVIYTMIRLYRGRSPRALAGFAGVFCLSLLPFPSTNHLLYGSPFVTGYQRAAEAAPGSSAIPGSERIVTVDHVDRFNQPLIKGLIRLLVHPSRGVLLTNPVVLLAFLGLFWWRGIRHRPEVFLIVGVGFIQLLFYATYDDWATSHFSNRFLMTFVALSSVLAGHAISQLSDRFGAPSPGH